MAIRLQVDKTEAGQPGVEMVEFQNAQHYVKEFYTGCVLDTLEHNHYDDSDFDAIVYDVETNSIKTVEYGTTRFWTYLNTAWIDATDEVKERAAIVNEQGWRVSIQKWAEADSQKVKEGRWVEVVAGRKIAHGTLGLVVYRCKSKFSTKWDEKFSLKLQLQDGSTVWTDERNVKVHEPKNYMPTAEEMDKNANARRLDFRSSHSY